MSAVKCPGEVYVGRHTYTIVWHDAPFTPQNGSSDQELLGECWFTESELHIDRNQSPSMVRDTVMHESMHAVGYDIGALEFQTLAKMKGFELEEHIVSRYTPVFIEFLAKNPQLIKWLTTS